MLVQGFVHCAISGVSQSPCRGEIRPVLPNSGRCCTHIHALPGILHRNLMAAIIGCIISLLGKPNADSGAGRCRAGCIDWCMQIIQIWVLLSGAFGFLVRAWRWNVALVRVWMRLTTGGVTGLAAVGFRTPDACRWRRGSGRAQAMPHAGYLALRS
jgi:hypothetical protein